MSKIVYVSTREIRGDRFHQSFSEFQGVYKTLALAKENWFSNMHWVEDETGGTWDCMKRRAAPSGHWV